MKFSAKMFNSGNGFITAVIDGKLHNIGKEHKSYNLLLKAFQEDDADDFVAYLKDNLTPCVKKLNDDIVGVNLTISNGIVTLNKNGVSFNLNSELSSKIVSAVNSGASTKKAIIKLFENMLLNDSTISVVEGFDFLQHKNLPITEDGCFLAYKCVTHDYLDKHSKTIVNTPGTVVKVERLNVDDDRRKECSYGLHVGCLEYSGPNGWFHSSGDKVVIVKVNPKDIVSVPLDHNATKMRVCEYVVLCDYEQPLPDDFHNVPREEIKITSRIDVNQIKSGQTIAFDYKGQRRHATVEWCETDNIETILVSPETYAGGFRRFTLDKMSNIEVIY